MTRLNFFLVTFDRLYYKVFSELSDEEKDMIYCYAVRPDVSKILVDKRIKRINEWELPWHDSRYQTLQYYEYGAMIHLYKNPNLVEDLTHIGILHYDTIFLKNSVNSIISELESNPNQIFYINKTSKEWLYFSKDQLNNICDLMRKSLDMEVNADYIWENQWIREALSVTPKDVLLKFGKFLYESQYEIEDILKNNRWGIMNKVFHRPCGFSERLFGIYLMSLKLPENKMNIIHDWDSYYHDHGDQIKDLKL
jgi:hypothetical protein